MSESVEVDRQVMMISSVTCRDGCARLCAVGFWAVRLFTWRATIATKSRRPGYAGALLGDKQHWVRRLPGKLLQNIISHGIARIAEFLEGDSPEVISYGSTSPLLRALGETDIIDELRVIIHDANGTTAYFTFSSQMRPGLHGLRIYGT